MGTGFLRSGAVAFTLMLALVACGPGSGSDEAASNADDETETVDDGSNSDELFEFKVATHPGAELVYASYWMADIQGYFEEEGIENRFFRYANGPVGLSDLAAGQLHGAKAAYIPHVISFTQGTPQQVVASVTKGNTTLVGGPDVEEIADLDGQRVGTPGLGTIHHAIMLKIANEEGISPELVPSSVTDLPVMLERGELAAFISWETIASQTVLDVEGAHYLARPLPDSENLQLALRTDFIEENPDLAQGVVNAVYRGARYAETCPEETQKEIARIMGTPFDEALEIVEAAAPAVKVTDPWLDLEGAKEWYELAVDEGLVQPVHDDFESFNEEFYNPVFLEQAEAEYGDWTPDEC